MRGKPVEVNVPKSQEFYRPKMNDVAVLDRRISLTNYYNNNTLSKSNEHVVKSRLWQRNLDKSCHANINCENVNFHVNLWHVFDVGKIENNFLAIEIVECLTFFSPYTFDHLTMQSFFRDTFFSFVIFSQVID